jgi:hypothetical protein
MLTQRRLDVLPSRLFKARLPLAFVQEYIHWYDHDRNEVIFRARQDPWSTQGTEWRLVREGSAWSMVNSTSVLMNTISNTARIVSSILSPLDDKEHINIILDTTTQSLQITLPRLQLDFTIKHLGLEVESLQYRGMVVDLANQTMGTLVGLASKLVLKSVDQNQYRLVLIPYGPRATAYTRVSGQHHVRITINKDKALKVYAYSLDTTLDRILDTGDVQRKLFLAFLHALTSHCLPDPLTGYTGTESALTILQSAAVYSFEYLTASNVDLLSQIAAISPVRAFYPRNLMVMQQVEWDSNLTPLAQHAQLRSHAQDIILQAKKMRLFFPDNVPDTTAWAISNPHLEARAVAR